MLKVWPGIAKKAKEGGLDVIETYVFWNYHEPVKGEVDFSCNFCVIGSYLYVHVQKL